MKMLLYSMCRRFKTGFCIYRIYQAQSPPRKAPRFRICACEKDKDSFVEQRKASARTHRSIDRGNITLRVRQSTTSKATGAAARKAEAKTVRDKSKVDGRHTHINPAAIERSN